MADDGEERRLGAVLGARVARLVAQRAAVDRRARLGRPLVAAAVRQPVDAADRPVAASQAGREAVPRQGHDGRPRPVAQRDDAELGRDVHGVAADDRAVVGGDRGVAPLHVQATGARDGDQLVPQEADGRGVDALRAPVVAGVADDDGHVPIDEGVGQARRWRAGRGASQLGVFFDEYSRGGSVLWGSDRAGTRRGQSASVRARGGHGRVSARAPVAVGVHILLLDDCVVFGSAWRPEKHWMCRSGRIGSGDGR